MRFPRTFSRRVGAGEERIPLLRSDEAPPAEALDETAAAKSLGADNVLVSRPSSTLGWPVQRVAAAWVPPPGKDSTAPLALDFAAYIFDHRTGFWLLMSEVSSVRPRRVFTLDCVVLLDSPTAGKKGGQVAGPQALEVMLVPAAVSNGYPVDGVYPEGVYTFLFGADVSSSP